MRRVLTTLSFCTIVGCGGSQAPVGDSYPDDDGPGDGEPTAGGAAVQPIPEGFFSLTPSLVVSNVTEAVAFYESALGAQRRLVMPGPDGETPMHAEIQIGDSIVMLSAENEEHESRGPTTLGGTNGSLLVYVEDVDAAYAGAVEAGATATRPVADMFWGDRYGQVTDPFGHKWSLATHRFVVSDEDMATRAQAFAAALAGNEPPPTYEDTAAAPSWKPERFHTVTPSLTVSGADAVEFYRTALGAEIVTQTAMPDGRLMHAELRIGDSIVMMSGEFPDMEHASKTPANLGGAPLSLMIYVENADELFAQATGANATESMPMRDMFWGDRFGQVTDPSGHNWGIATHQHDYTPEQIMENMREQFGGEAPTE